MLKSMAATAAFGGLHSLTASTAAKDWFARTFGERERNAFYRPFYVVESAVTLGLLALYIQSQPARVVWKVTGGKALVMRLMQLGWLGFAAAAAHEVGITKMTGVDGILAWLRGDEDIPPEPEAQGPAPDDHGMKDTGPFQVSQHPLNFAFLPIFWLFPTMTTSLLGFSLVGSLYLWLGSFHEAARLHERHGREYDAYVEEDVPFFAPLAWPPRASSPRSA